jgi:Zn-dependent peptidase ImmA (M78 family)
MSLSIPGFRVRQARVLRSRSSGELASSLGWTPSRLSRIENSVLTDLEASDVELLSRELEFPEGFFVHPDADCLLDGDLLFRAKSTPKKERQYLADFAAVAGEVLHWLDSYHHLPGVLLPRRLLGPEPLQQTEIADVARAARLALGIHPDEPVPHLTYQLERAGVVVVMRDRGLHPGDVDSWDKDAVSLEKHIGYSAWVGRNRDRPMAVVRSLSSWERTRWTLAHELGHLMLHRGRLVSFAEDEASRFASEFLAPVDVLVREVPRLPTLGNLLPLKLQWGISLYALVRHLRSVDLITEERYKSLTDQLHVRRNSATGRTWRRDEPGWDARDPERPGLIRAWAERCLGTSEPNALATMSDVWPGDVFSALLAYQRASHAKQAGPSKVLEYPQSPDTPSAAARVIDINSRRRENFG